MVGNGIVDFWHENSSRVPMLTAEQEIFYARQIQEWLTAEAPTPKQIRRGQKAKKRFISSNLRLVISVCKKFTKRISRTANIELEDLYQEGVIGLNRAAEKFDPESGYKFSNYAFWWISQGVRRYMEIYSTTIRTSCTAVQVALRWRYRPEGQSIEEFAAEEGKTVEWIKTYLQGFRNAQTRSLDAVARGAEESDGCLADFVSAGVTDEDEIEYADILNELHSIPEINDSLAILELSQEAKPAELAPLMECSPTQVRKKLKDYSAQIREHFPADLRERLNGKEKVQCGKIEEQIPAPVRELALINCCSTESESMPEVSSNGHHHSLEAEAIAVINEVQESEAPKQPRKRRSSAEVAASGNVALKINGMDMEGSAADVAAVLKAYSV